MSGLKYKITYNAVRDNRNQALAYIDIYCKSLAVEIADLDIRHKIDKRIFADTEMLRGYLCGYFDGDGGISGNTVTCIYGKNDD